MYVWINLKISKQANKISESSKSLEIKKAHQLIVKWYAKYVSQTKGLHTAYNGFWVSFTSEV